MKNQVTFSIFLLLITFLSFGCGDVEPREAAPDSPYNPLVDTPDKRLLNPPEKPLFRLKDKDWEKLKGDDWIALTDADVEELMNLVLPQRWALETEDPVLFRKYRAASLFQRFGDLPQVRYEVEFLQQPTKDEFVEVDLLSITFERRAAWFEARYFLFRNPDTRRSLEEIRNLMDAEKDRLFLDRLRRKNPEAWVEHKHAALLRQHGDIPEVDRIADFLRKVEFNLPRTDRECHGYIETYISLYDHITTGSRYEYYAKLEAHHQVIRLSAESRRRLEKYRQARAAGISFDDIDRDEDAGE